MKVDQDVVSKQLFEMSKNRTGVLSYHEFIMFYFLLPAIQTIPQKFDYWQRGSIDIGCEPVHCEHHSRDKFNTILAGMMAGAVSRTATAPLTRFVLLLQSTHESPLTMRQAFTEMRTEGGVKSFWRGNLANILKIGP